MKKSSPSGMTIDLPDLKTQKDIVRQDSTNKAIEQLKKNLDAPHIEFLGFDHRRYGDGHLKMESDWTPPSPELVNAWFEHFKNTFPGYESDKKLGELLGLKGNADRRIRSFRNGERPIPYGIWRRFLIITGRVYQEIIPVIAIVDDE
ncbi:hypothetical protein [Dickeya sp. NCPPB 3274]|uniref:hypothetical protein n=1 Tax=Dickeya sp. NCPPB 3274 TaxID=568766 RepID=UPI001EE64B06|nr:hypothetical protein [Dickeya sp. NCPPB 3274]